jgi:hypothetical protein
MGIEGRRPRTKGLRHRHIMSNIIRGSERMLCARIIKVEELEEDSLAS